MICGNQATLIAGMKRRISLACSSVSQSVSQLKSVIAELALPGGSPLSFLSSSVIPAFDSNIEHFLPLSSTDAHDIRQILTNVRNCTPFCIPYATASGNPPERVHKTY